LKWVELENEAFADLENLGLADLQKLDSADYIFATTGFGRLFAKTYFNPNQISTEKLYLELLNKFY